MSEWWTYTLSDFLLFSPQTYYRLFELYNAAIWPAQIVAVGLGLAIWALLRRAAAIRGRLIAAILAGCWLWVAIAFHANRYATINWAAVYFAWGFGLEAALLIWAGTVRGRLVFERPVDLANRAGLWIFLLALAVAPLVGPIIGRGWRQVEIFGVAPDPTAVATLGILLLANGRGSWALIAVPAIWCAISGATLLAMKAPDAWIPALAAVLVVSLTVWKTLVRRRTRGA
ncbi:MAG TPA: DUF6064 family protein [Thermoanaerobaculia bacterium]|nr:DUF6064 family protein [Thermoanaerobaculia bacterium]